MSLVFNERKWKNQEVGMRKRTDGDEVHELKTNKAM